MNDKLATRPKLYEYRCTRPDIYPPGSTGYRDRAARQGHYIIAQTSAAARAVMRKRFPGDVYIDVDCVGEADMLASEDET